MTAELYSTSIEALSLPVKSSAALKANAADDEKRSAKKALAAAKRKAKKAAAADVVLAEQKGNKIAQLEEQLSKLVEKKKRVRKPKVSVETTSSSEEAPVEKKKRVRKPKVTPTEEELIDEAVDEVEPKPKKAKIAVDEVAPKPKKAKVDVDAPPAWFTKYVRDQLDLANTIADEKKSANKLKQEAKVVSNEKWADPKIRDKVETQERTMRSKLYSQIFK